MSRILVATDGSPHAETAAAAAKRLFGPESEFIVLTVAHGPTAPSAYPAPMLAPGFDLFPVETQRDIEASVAARAESIVADIASIFGEQAETRVDWGPSGRTICDTAVAVQADVIVLGDHGHGWLGDRLMGSVARYVTHHAPCGIYLHRDPARDESAR